MSNPARAAVAARKSATRFSPARAWPVGSSAQFTLGSAISFQRIGLVDLDGADGFRYDISCDGELNDGGTVDRRFTTKTNLP